MSRARIVMLAALGIGGAISMSAATRAAPGKIVRVERSAAALHEPMLCMISGVESARCFGQPAIGDIIDVVGVDRVRGELRITGIEPPSAACAGAVFEVHVEVASGDRMAGFSGFGLVHVPLDLRVARVVHADSSPAFADDQVVFAIDRDNDGAADFEVAAYRCDAQGNRASTRARLDATCVDLWLRDGSWQRASTVTIPQCL